ncbi:DUF421 domain-containing protein [Kaistella sp. PBT33-4]|uniref:DUF421 domain-containing protein n=1 Tax=Kaistella sp. PBT33-4 TaxID=3032000 RepID=UPI0023D83F85|nr:YetF domain-containing protein [Kaistella sp. PBT33-4]MDF0719974.1 DUF421 domain-containing protein [Kaistella sp. PBT33-4]
MNTIAVIDWKDLLLGSEDWSFLPEVILRTVIMFLIIILGLRILGKRGVKQLSVFELVVIIGLGSAAGDPMFYKDVGIVFSLLVFIVIIALYALLTYFLGKSKRFEDMVEGKPVCLIRDGVFELENFKKENLGNDEFFAELRLRGISHLGQIETAIEETSGGVSVFFLEADEIRYGLPIMLNSLDNPLKQIEKAGYYSCTFCGFTEEKAVGAAGNCSHCGKEKWVSASNNKRVT